MERLKEALVAAAHKGTEYIKLDLTLASFSNARALFLVSGNHDIWGVRGLFTGNTLMPYEYNTEKYLGFLESARTVSASRGRRCWRGVLGRSLCAMEGRRLEGGWRVFERTKVRKMQYRLGPNDMPFHSLGQVQSVKAEEHTPKSLKPLGCTFFVSCKLQGFFQA